MTASAADRRARICGPLPRLLWALVALSALAACAKPPQAAPEDLLLPIPARVIWIPEPSDLASARLAAAALAGDSEQVAHALAAVAGAQDSHTTRGLGSLAQDVANSTLDDADRYRKAARELARRPQTDPALKARLEQSVQDDPQRIAGKRSRDRWKSLWARSFNAIAEPLGGSLISGFVLAPINLALSSAHYLASFSNDEPASLTDRQALVLRREALARSSDPEQAAKLARQVAKGEDKLARTLARRRLRAARSALDQGQAPLAAVEAYRSLQIGPSRAAEKIRSQALARIEQRFALSERSLQAPEHDPRDARDAAASALAVELLARPQGLSRESLDRLAAAGSGPEGDEARFVLALVQHEAGLEDEARGHLRTLAAKQSSMARHARHLLDSPGQDPWQSFVETRRRQKRERLRWHLLGAGSHATPYPNLPRPLAVLVETPGVVQSVVTAPLRLLFSNWHATPDFERPVAAAGYRYLGLHPGGEHAREALAWLLEYERERENWVAALRVADFLPDLAAAERSEILAAASQQVLAAAERSRRRDERGSILRHVVTEFPDSEAGRQAGLRARGELLQGSAQQIRMTRGFLLENPRVAGPEGLGINSLLLNDRKEEGELHPNGVSFVGGRRLRFELLAESGDPDDEPMVLYRSVSAQRLARVAAMLDETARRNQLIDADDQLAPDADRDQFLERARLGIADEPDARPSAESIYVYKSMRERYGMVRGRESILPFDLVLRGDFQNLSLGAFPRWHEPKETPDAFLYR